MHKLTKHSKLSDTDRKRKSVLFSHTPHSIKLSVRIPSPHTLICVTTCMCDRWHCYKPMPENIFKVLTAVNIQIMVYLVWLFRYQRFRGTCCHHLQDWRDPENGGSSSSNTSVPVYQTICHHITEDPDLYADCLIRFPNTLCCRNLFIKKKKPDIPRPIKIKDQMWLNMFMLIWNERTV